MIAGELSSSGAFSGSGVFRGLWALNGMKQGCGRTPPPNWPTVGRQMVPGPTEMWGPSSVQTPWTDTEGHAVAAFVIPGRVCRYTDVCPGFNVIFATGKSKLAPVKSSRTPTTAVSEIGVLPVF